MDYVDRDAMIRAVMAEAGNQGPVGQAAVAHVIMNRTKTGKWGDSPLDVVLAKNQFEPFNTARGRNEIFSKPTDDPAYQNAAKVVDAVIAGKVADPTGGATHFLNPKTVQDRGTYKTENGLPSWAARPPLTVIGGHAFYAPDGRVNDSTPLPYTETASARSTGGNMSDSATLLQQMMAQMQKQPQAQQASGYDPNHPLKGMLGRVLGNLFAGNGFSIQPVQQQLPQAAQHIMAANAPQPAPYEPAPSSFPMSDAPMPPVKPPELANPQTADASPQMPAPDPQQDPLQAAAAQPVMGNPMTQPEGQNPDAQQMAMAKPDDTSSGLGGFGGLFSSLFGGA